MSHQGGFTLMELLVAVGILAIVAGIATPAVVKFMGTSQVKAAESELSNIQDAVDAMMSDKGLGSLPTTSPVTGTADALADTAGEATSNMAVFPYTDSDYSLASEYMRTDAVGTYTVATDGTVTQVTTGY